MRSIPLAETNKIFLALSKSLVLSEYKKGNFSYSFKRLSKERSNQSLALFHGCEKFLESEDFKTLVGKISGLDKLKLKTWFISKYEKVDFLSKHNDSENGKIGFVFYLSKNWDPYFGGSLQFYLRKTKQQLFSYEPAFNGLLLFPIKNDPPLLHEVMPVTAEVERIAISGWLG